MDEAMLKGVNVSFFACKVQVFAKEKTRPHDAIGFFVQRAQIGKTGLANIDLLVSSSPL
jgi:hypothetical protein